MPPPTAPPLVLPRGLIMLTSVWLVVSWIISIGFRTPVEASSASYTPGVRIMLICTVIGLMIAWPLLRLSQGRATFPVKQTVLDLVVLLALLQVVIWPLRLVTPWSVVRTAAIDATLVAWTGLAGAFVASATGAGRPGPRNLAMLGCVGACLAGPALAWVALAVPSLAGLSDRLLHLGPLLEVHDLTLGAATPPASGQWKWILLVSGAATGSWAALAVLPGPGPGSAPEVTHGER